MFEDKKIAIVYDWIDKWGGVERVLLTLHEMFPKAKFYTSYFDINSASWAKNFSLQPSFIQKLPSFIRKSRFFSLPLYPFAFESFNFSSYDVVISVTSSFSKAVITKPDTRHICYLLTPTRYLWSHAEEYQGGFQKNISSLYSRYLKKWDLVASQRPDAIISISETVAKRCEKYYKRDSEVIYPPFDLNYWQHIKFQIPNSKFQTNSKFQIPNSKFFLVVSRLEPYKKIDLAIDAFNELNSSRVRSDNRYSLVIVGEGGEERWLRRISGKNIIFLSKLTDRQLGFLYQKAEGLIMPQEEDFGYVSLEAQFFGCPVIAYDKGGARETVIEGKTGIFFENQSRSSLRQALERFHTISYNIKNSTRKLGPKNVNKFNKKKFVEKFYYTIEHKNI